MNVNNLEIRLKLPRAAYELNVDITVPARGITVLFGASGSGKTSVLRCVAGLERGLDAYIRVGNDIWQDDAAQISVPAWARSLGYVFQEASLFEHLDVRGNLQFGLRRMTSNPDPNQLDGIVNLLGIRPLLNRRTDQLSGGERQRVAIARALATSPRLLLLDEPLASLDDARRREIMPWLERMRDELSTPILYVSHSADEVARLADHVVVLDQGKVKASGAAAEIFSSANSSVTFGDDTGALLDGQIEERDERWHLARAAFPGGSLWLRDVGLAPGQKLRMQILARDVSISLDEPRNTSIQNCLPCNIVSVVQDAHPSQALVRIQCGDSLLLAKITQRAADALQLRPGMAAWAQVKSVALIA